MGVISGFICSRLLFGGLGFLSFAIKFAHLQYQLRQPHTFGLHTLVWQVGLLFGFVNQAFGITQVAHVETDRLFLFIFGGEDAKMQAGELDRQEAYLARVVYTILNDLWCDDLPRQRMFKRAIALVSLTHIDVQSLVLDEDET